jgi:uncharacterized protein
MSIQATIEKFHPSGKFLLLTGLFLLFLGVASIAQVVILAAFADMHSMIDIVKLTDFSNPAIIKGMRIAQGVSAILTFIIPALLFAWLGSEKKLGYLKLDQPFHPVVGMAVILLVFAAMPVINWAGEVNSHLSLPGFMSGVEDWMKSSEESLKKLTEAFLQMNGISDLLVNLIVVALLAAVGEELLFRGGMQNIFLEWLKNKHAAVWITAILFSALHAQFYGFLPRMLLGVILGYLYIWSGSLWLSVLFHFINNGMAVLFSYLIGKEALTKSAETIGAGESPFYFVLVSAAVSAGLMYFVYKNRLKSETTSTEVPLQE